jgi:predicted RNase H-like HicB family nuclease
VDSGRIPEVPGAISQGRTREKARENVIDALHGILELRFGEHALRRRPTASRWS